MSSTNPFVTRKWWEMPVEYQMRQELSEEEKQAGSAYGADSTFHHAVHQGRSDEVNCQRGYAEYSRKARVHRDALDIAIQKSVLTAPATLYSAHGRGLFVRGALIGAASSFVGLQYSYPGYISTSDSLEWARNFLRPRHANGSRPTLLRFQLPEGSHALDMNLVGHSGESEFLLGRKLLFNIVAGEGIDVDGIDEEVLFFTLTLLPAG